MKDIVPVYEEQLTSNRTMALFIALSIIFTGLSAWRASTAGFDALAVIFLCLGVIFLFYVVNYRRLKILITPEALKLRFGIFSWTVPVDNIQGCQLDDVPAFLKLGGAGIHFYMLRDRYRASFNFLEYPRVVIALKRKKGMVSELSFSTRRPDEVIWFIRDQLQTEKTLGS